VANLLDLHGADLEAAVAGILAKGFAGLQLGGAPLQGGPADGAALLTLADLAGQPLEPPGTPPQCVTPIVWRESQVPRSQKPGCPSACDMAFARSVSVQLGGGRTRSSASPACWPLLPQTTDCA